jgi:phosphoglycolate phosphatase-like HAD superfamily hydrolase
MFRSTRKLVTTARVGMFRNLATSFRVPQQIRLQAPVVQLQNSNQKVEGVLVDGAGTSGDEGAIAPGYMISDAVEKHKGVRPDMSFVKKFTGSAKDWHIDQVLQRMAEQKQIVYKAGDVSAVYKIFLRDGLTVLALHSKPVPGIKEALDLQRSKGRKIILVTAYGDDEAAVFAESMKKGGVIFDDIVTSSMVKNSRPFSSLPNLAMDRNKLRFGCNVVGFGDSVFDMESLAPVCWAVGTPETSTLLNINSLEEFAKMSEAERNLRFNHAAQTLRTHGAHYVMLDPKRPLSVKMDEVIKDVELRLSYGERPGLPVPKQQITLDMGLDPVSDSSLYRPGA